MLGSYVNQSVHRFQNRWHAWTHHSRDMLCEGNGSTTCGSNTRPNRFRVLRRDRTAWTNRCDAWISLQRPAHVRSVAVWTPLPWLQHAFFVSVPALEPVRWQYRLTHQKRAPRNVAILSSRRDDRSRFVGTPETVRGLLIYQVRAPRDVRCSSHTYRRRSSSDCWSLFGTRAGSIDFPSVLYTYSEHRHAKEEQRRRNFITHSHDSSSSADTEATPVRIGALR